MIRRDFLKRAAAPRIEPGSTLVIEFGPSEAEFEAAMAACRRWQAQPTTEWVCFRAAAR